MEEIRVAEFFAGIGGFRSAFQHLPSFKFVFVNDCDKHCKTTYDANFPEPHMTVADIRTLDISNLPDFDMMVGGFPCQSFSIQGSRKGLDDERGRMFYELLKIIDVKKPRLLLFENVKGIVHMNKCTVFRGMLKELEDRGYTMQYKVINTCIHSHVPQHRERVYIVGSSLTPFEFTFPTKALTLPIEQFLEAPESIPSICIYKPESHPKSYELLKKELIERHDAVPYTFYVLWSCTQLRRRRVGCCPTLMASMSRGGHSIPVIYDGQNIRALTTRECFNLQGFAKDYVLPSTVPRTVLYKQAGNALTSALAKRIATNLNEALILQTVGTLTE